MVALLLRSRDRGSDRFILRELRECLFRSSAAGPYALTMRARLTAAVTVAIVLAAGLAARSCQSEHVTTSVAHDGGAQTAGETPGASSLRERARVRLPAPAPGSAPDPERVAVTAAKEVRAPVLVDGVIPEEDRGTGSAVVELKLVSAATGQAIESQVRLWRLNNPATDRWPAGDHIQDQFRIRGTHLAKDLPPGRYRLEILASAPGEDDPPEFVVRDGQPNAFLARIELPEERAMRLRVFSEHGVQLTEGSWRSAGDGSGWGRPEEAPTWARPRATRTFGTQAFGGRGGGHRNLSTARRFQLVEARLGAFDLGLIRRSGRHFKWSRNYRFRFPERSEVYVRMRSEDADKGDCYIAVSVALWPLTNAVRLPDGRSAADAGAEFDIECLALLDPSNTPGFWRTVPVRIEATLDGYEKLKYEWRINDGTPAQQTMKATAP
jgi:hypothetical protein